MIKVTIVWMDSYTEEIDVEDVRTENPFLRLCMTDGRERMIPLSSIRYFSQGRKYTNNQSQNQGGMNAGIDTAVMDFAN